MGQILVDTDICSLEVCPNATANHLDLGDCIFSLKQHGFGMEYMGQQ